MGLSKLLSSRALYNVPRLLQRTYCANVAGEKKSEKDGTCTVAPVDGDKKALVLGVYEAKDKFELTPAAEEVDAKSGGKLCAALNELSCQMKLGKAFILTDVLPEYSAVALASYGPKDAGYNKLEEIDEERENIRWGVGAGVSLLKRRGVRRVVVDAATASDAAAEAAKLAAWTFEDFKACEDRQPRIVLEPYKQSDTWQNGVAYGRAQNWARWLSDMPANKMTPVDFAQNTLDVLCKYGIKVAARDQSWIEQQNMEAFLTVARGSCEPPIFLECSYNGGPTGMAPVLLAAKGVTFDSGGLCLKRPESMVENRGSMAGAAVVVAAMRALAELKVPVNLEAVIPLCENMVSGQCMKVGDVVRTLNGLSVVIEDTDMEGRLMLADALVYGQALHRPSLVVDVATLTHGILLATGGAAFGCFSSSDAWWRRAAAAGATAGDRPWRLPIWDYYARQITDEAAVDLRNKGSGRATPCLGAAFLKKFVCTDWLHMDITGVGKLSHGAAPPYLHPRRMSGRPARALAALLHGASCPDPDHTQHDKKNDKDIAA